MVGGGRVAVRRARVLEEILEVAWDLARERGLAALSLREIAGRMGMRAPSLYTYLDSKNALYDAMFAQGQHALLAVMTADPKPTPDRAGLLEGSQRFVDFCVADPTRYQLMFLRVVPGFVPSEEAFAPALAYFTHFTSVMAEAGITEQSEVDLWTAAVAGLLSQQLANEPGTDRWTRLLPTTVEMLCDRAGLPRTTAPREDA